MGPDNDDEEDDGGKRRSSVDVVRRKAAAPAERLPLPDALAATPPSEDRLKSS